MSSTLILQHSETPAGWNGHPLFTLENLYQAYRSCRRRKRNTHNALAFEQNLEANLLELHQSLNDGSYEPERSIAFLVEKPKRREIFAASFRDRVVHHLLINHIEPAWEKHFIHDSYACRKNKGTHKGVERLQGSLRKATANNTRPAWYLQLDVRGFFVAINRQILYRQLQTKHHDPAILWLIRQVLFADPTDQCQFRGHSRQAFDALPEHKTLFKSKPDCGLPIGNLSSQFFANVYLDALDQFVKHQLKARYYLRYCDDLVLVSTDKAELQEWEQQITAFLNERLGLKLNERRKLRPVADGVDFLGYVIRPDYLLVRRRVVHALQERLQQTEKQLRRHGLERSQERTQYPYPWGLLTALQLTLQSYLAHFARASSHHLLQRLQQCFWWLTAYFDVSALSDVSKAVLKFQLPRFLMNFRQQFQALVDCCPGYLCLVQVGQFWQSNTGKRIHQHNLTAFLNAFPQTPFALFRETGISQHTLIGRQLVFRSLPSKPSTILGVINV